jgi:hypothetical protein
MECKVAESAPISARIQNYAKASTELNPGGKRQSKSSVSVAEKFLCFWIIRRRKRSEKSQMK